MISEREDRVMGNFSSVPGKTPDEVLEQIRQVHEEGGSRERELKVRSLKAEANQSPVPFL